MSVKIRRHRAGLFAGQPESYLSASDVTAWLDDLGDRAAARDDHTAAYWLRWAGDALARSVADAEFLEHTEAEFRAWLRATELVPLGCSMCGWVGPPQPRGQGGRLLERHFVDDHGLGTDEPLRRMPWQDPDPCPIPRLRWWWR